MILSIPKKNVEDTNGDITPEIETSNTAMKYADRLPQWSEMIPKINAPNNIPAK